MKEKFKGGKKRVCILCPNCRKSFYHTIVSAIEWKMLNTKDICIGDNFKKNNLVKVFSVKCPYCQKNMEHTHPLIVYSKEKRWAVQFIKGDGRYVKPPIILILRQFKCRTTYSQECFIEKATIFSNGLDDYAVELVKHYLKSGTKSQESKNTKLFFIGLDILGDLIFKILIIGSGKESAKREIGGRELYQIAVSMVERIRKKRGREKIKRWSIMVDYIMKRDCRGLFKVVDSSTIEPLF